MTKDKIYKKVQALFPSELGVGDVVEVNKKDIALEHKIFTVIKNAPKSKEVLPHCYLYNSFFGGSNYYRIEWLKLIRKRITLSMVLEMQFIVNKKKFTDLDHDEYNYEDWVSDCYVEEIQDIIKLWQLRKDGKDLDLYDQSIETIKFIYEVLK